MGITRDTIARMLVWVTALTVPVQGLPAASCGCASSKTGCHKEEQSDACCPAGGRKAVGNARHGYCQRQSHEPCRCTGAKVCRCGESSRCRNETKCCGASNATIEGYHGWSVSVASAPGRCTCGLNCQCGTTSQQEPATPPVQKNPTDKVASDWLTTLSVAAVCRPQSTRRQVDARSFARAVTALDRCASLCRFAI
jgi:hypothetical protein